MAMYPSSNIPSWKDLQGQYAALAAGARERDVSAPFKAARNTAALGHAMNLEALAQEEEKRQRMAKAQAVDRGMEVLGGSLSADDRFRKAVERGGQQYNQAAAQLGIQQAQAEAQQQARADAMEAQGIGLRSQELQLAAREQLQMQLAQLQATQRQLDRQATKELSDARNNLDRQRISNEYNLRRASILVQMRSIGEQIAASKARRGALGGGLRVTRTELSPGGSGRSGMNPSSRYAWS